MSSGVPPYSHYSTQSFSWGPVSSGYAGCRGGWSGGGWGGGGAFVVGQMVYIKWHQRECQQRGFLSKFH